MRAMRILAALACAAITVGAARAEEHEAAPAGPPLVLPASPAQPLVDLVRDLQRVQDGVATGDATAIPGPRNHITDDVWGVNDTAGGVKGPAAPDVPIVSR